MSELYAIDKCINEFEFRNFVAWFLEKKEYHFVSMDDDRWSDNESKNDNDFIVVKDGTKYTVQVFLNKKINNDIIEETEDDIERENVLDGIVFTNMEVTERNKNYALKKHITIFDKIDLEKEFYDYKTNENEVK